MEPPFCHSTAGGVYQFTVRLRKVAVAGVVARSAHGIAFTDMARKQKPKIQAPAPKLRGRPPLPPRTTLARWIQDHGKTVAGFAVELRTVAPSVGLAEDDAPMAKTLLDAVNARHWPSPRTILLVRHATGGDVDVEHWVRDLHYLLAS